MKSGWRQKEVKLPPLPPAPTPSTLQDSDMSLVSAASEYKSARVAQCRVLKTEQQEEWMEVLRRVVQHDFQHLPPYHRVEGRRLNPTAHLLTHRENDYLLALPLLLRLVGESPLGWNDATLA